MRSEIRMESIATASSPPGGLAHTPGPHDRLTATQGACKSCKGKKLKCDRLPLSCSNCTRLKEVCMNVDPLSGVPYSRRYVDELYERAEQLRTRLRRQQGTTQESQIGMVPQFAITPNTQPEASPHYSGSVSVFSLGQLVAAAVSRGSNESVLRLGTSIGQESRLIERLHAETVPLPSLGDAVELVESYFRALHVTMPFLRKKDVFRQLERLYTDMPPYSGYEKEQDLFQLHMIFAIGSLRHANVRRDHKAKNHYATAMTKEASLTDIPAYGQIQNLLLVFVFATLHNVGIASTWEIIRQTMRVCVEFGLHSRVAAENDIVREQLRRRIFWSTYISDRHCSQNLDRPVAIPEEDITIEPPINQQDEQLESGVLEDSEEFTEVSTLIRHVLLRRLGTVARTALNETIKTCPEDISRASKDWIVKLQAWYDRSIVKTAPDNAYETNEYLDINFHRERMKILSYAVLPIVPNVSITSVDDLWQYIHSAYTILSAYQKQAKDGHLILNWTCVQDALKSGFGILYCATSIPDQRRREGHGGVLLRSELDTLATALSVCGEVLSHITARWHTVHRHANAFQQMSEAVLGLIARNSCVVTREQTPNMDGNAFYPGEEVVQWDFEGLDTTIPTFQHYDAPFTDADWAEIFDLELGTA